MTCELNVYASTVRDWTIEFVPFNFSIAQRWSKDGCQQVYELGLDQLFIIRVYVYCCFLWKLSPSSLLCCTFYPKWKYLPWWPYIMGFQDWWLLDSPYYWWPCQFFDRHVCSLSRFAISCCCGANDLLSCRITLPASSLIPTEPVVWCFMLASSSSLPKRKLT